MTDKELQLLHFLAGEGKDNNGRIIDTIWAFSDKELEKVHDYIQWIFPLKEKSSFNPNCVTLTNEMIQYIQTSEVIQKNLVLSFQRMCNFYGMAYILKTNDIQIIKTQKEIKQTWLNPFNHNFKRISRIIGSLVLCGRSDLAEIFYKKMEFITFELFYCNSHRKYWKKALSTK